MQAVDRVRGVQRQRVFHRFRAAIPFMRWHPGRNTWAILILHFGNGVGVDLDFTGWRPQWIEQRVFAIVGETHPLGIGLRHREAHVIVGLPEHVERWQGYPGSTCLSFHVIVHAFQPLSFIFAFGKGVLHPQLGRHGRENIEIAA
ncbi:hypothetical protein D3C72_1845640 [compost metagenome]